MTLENKYLIKALIKAKYVVIVESYKNDEEGSRLEYISSNAQTIGINSDLVVKGLKLVVDYIHPEDRNVVVNAIHQAVENHVEDYVHEFRMVGDDGKLYYVSSDMTITWEDENSYKVEYLLHTIDGSGAKAAPKKKMTGQRNIARVDEAGNFLKSAETDEKIEAIMNMFSQLTGLYSIFVDTDGKMLTQPKGPATNMGDFYDLFEKPAYKEYFKLIRSVVTDGDSPVIMDREEGGAGKIAATPIRIKESLVGFWILGSYTVDETEMLKRSYENHWMIADLISDYLYKSNVVEVEAGKSKSAEAKLKKELERQNVINNALVRANAKEIDEVEVIIEQTMKDAGELLGIDRMIMYTAKKGAGREYYLRCYWDANSSTVPESIDECWPRQQFMREESMLVENGRLVIDNNNMSDETRFMMINNEIQASIVYPVYLNDKMYGVLLFIETEDSRVWTKGELSFSKSIALVMQNMLENAEGDDNIRTMNKHLIETYNNFADGVFVRNAYSGEVLFSNTKMNTLMGKNFTGGDSREVLTDLHDRFDNITGMRKPFITKERVSNWRSYIKSMDAIMDITEVQIEWYTGEPASLIILRKSNDLRE